MGDGAARSFGLTLDELAAAAFDSEDSDTEGEGEVEDKGEGSGPSRNPEGGDGTKLDGEGKNHGEQTTGSMGVEGNFNAVTGAEEEAMKALEPRATKNTESAVVEDHIKTLERQAQSMTCDEMVSGVEEMVHIRQQVKSLIGMFKPNDIGMDTKQWEEKVEEAWF